MTAEEKTKLKTKIKHFFLITFGGIAYGTAVSCFLSPNQIIPGGVTGCSIMINHYIDELNVGTLIFLLNIPIMAAGWIKFGFKFIISTIYALGLSSTTMNIVAVYLKDYVPLTDNMLLAAIAGGALSAVGMGLVFRGGATTGGTDIVIKFLRLKYRHIKTGVIFLVTDSVLIILSAVVFRKTELALYAALTLFVNTRLLDFVLYGSDEAKLLYIVSDKPDEIAQRLLSELSVGITFLKGEGAYTGQDKKVLLCAAHKRSFAKIRDIVTQTDDMAFLIVSSAQEIFGKGFKDYRSMDL